MKTKTISVLLIVLYFIAATVLVAAFNLSDDNQLNVLFGCCLKIKPVYTI